jgi:hypothetical protein
MEPLAESARDLMGKFSDAVGKNPERSGLYVSLIIIARSPEQITYLIESIAEDIVYSPRQSIFVTQVPPNIRKRATEVF